jgi:hypothetical protein
MKSLAELSKEVLKNQKLKFDFKKLSILFSLEQNFEMPISISKIHKFLQTNVNPNATDQEARLFVSETLENCGSVHWEDDPENFTRVVTLVFAKLYKGCQNMDFTCAELAAELVDYLRKPRGYKCPCLNE